MHDMITKSHFEAVGMKCIVSLRINDSFGICGHETFSMLVRDNWWFYLNNNINSMITMVCILGDGKIPMVIYYKQHETIVELFL